MLKHGHVTLIQLWGESTEEDSVLLTSKGGGGTSKIEKFACIVKGW